MTNKQTKTKGKIFSCFVDKKKTFGSIWHEGLLYKLMESGVGGKTCNIVKSMYTNNKCAITIGIKQTHFFPQGQGVRQGCSLSPTLFNIYINKLARALEQSALRICIQNSAKISSVYNVKHQIMHAKRN